ncbi:MAG TPA: heavy-metal-associated domain-containing protein [Gemmatimonadales bacterium]|jgi:copper chaperone CopZ|nr:heavy-metal-associated domain-containing protein [Gemmatimonadales bacterium]
MMANVKLRVTGMTCGHCQAKVEKALKSVSGVYSAVVELPNGAAQVDFDDDRLTTAQLIAAVQQTGYGAKLAG